MATKASRIALAGSNISSTGEVDADLLDNIDSAAFLSLDSNGRLGIGTSSPSRQLEIYDDGTVGQAVLALTAQNTDYSRIMFADPDDVNIGILDYAHSDNSMRFTVNNAIRMLIDSSGRVGIATGGAVNTNAHANADDFVIGNTSNRTGMTIVSATDSNGNIHFSDGTSTGNADISGQISYEHTDNSFRFYANSTTEVLRLTSSGGTVFNNGQDINQNFTVKASGNANAFFIDGNGGQVTIGGGSIQLTGGGVISSNGTADTLVLSGSNAEHVGAGTTLHGNAHSNASQTWFKAGSTTVMKIASGKVGIGGGFPNVNSNSNGVYNLIVADGICVGDGGYTHGYVGTNGTDGDVYIAANAYPANLSSDRSVRIAGGSAGGGGPNEIVRYNHSHGAIRNYNNNTTTNKKWWSTNSGNFGEVEEYDYGNKLYFKKTRAVSGYSQMLLLNRYMPNQYDVSFELVSPLDTTTYRHFGIALNHVGSESTTTFCDLVLRQHFTSSGLNAVRIDKPGGTVGYSQGSSIPNFHDGTKRKIMIQKRASTFRMQVHELNGSVYTYGTISGISWTNSSGYFGFGIYESTGTNTWAKISNLTFTDVIA